MWILWAAIFIQFELYQLAEYSQSRQWFIFHEWISPVSFSPSCPFFHSPSPPGSPSSCDDRNYAKYVCFIRVYEEYALILRFQCNYHTKNRQKLKLSTIHDNNLDQIANVQSFPHWHFLIACSLEFILIIIIIGKCRWENSSWQDDCFSNVVNLDNFCPLKCLFYFYIFIWNGMHQFQLKRSEDERRMVNLFRLIQFIGTMGTICWIVCYFFCEKNRRDNSIHSVRKDLCHGLRITVTVLVELHKYFLNFYRFFTCSQKKRSIKKEQFFVECTRDIHSM